MKRDPWTDPDPQPGDFDDYLANGGEVVVESGLLPRDLKVTFLEDDDPRLAELRLPPATRPAPAGRQPH